MTEARSNVVSSFTIVKGSLIDETFAAFADWDLEASKKENLDRLRESNSIGATSASWLRDVAKVLNRRFDPDSRDRSLVTLAKGGCPLDTWKPILLWHMTRDEFLLRDFLVHYLFDLYTSGAHRVTTEEVEEFVTSAPNRGGVVEHKWSKQTLHRVAVGLLKMANDFELLRGSVNREITSYHLPPDAFIYLLHAMRDDLQNVQKIVSSEEWRLFYMRPEDVQQELFRLHQYQDVSYQVAGSIGELSLPCPSAEAWAERIVA